MDQGQSEPVGDVWKYDADYHRTSEFLGVNQYDRGDSELAKKVSAIRDWTGDKELNDALWKIDGLRKRLGHQFMGKPLVNAMYQHIRLSPKQVVNKTQRSKAKQDPMSNIQKKISSSVQKTVSGPITKSIQNQVQGMIKQSVQNSISQTLNQVATDKKFISNTIQGVLKEAIK